MYCKLRTYVIIACDVEVVLKNDNGMMGAHRLWTAPMDRIILWADPGAGWSANNQQRSLGAEVNCRWASRSDCLGPINKRHALCHRHIIVQELVLDRALM